MAKRACPLCHSKKVIRLYKANIPVSYFDTPYKISDSEYGKHRDIYRCNACQTVFEDIQNHLDKVKKHYQTSEDTDYERERGNRSQAFKRVLSGIQSFRPTGRLLDVGCATGAFMAEARFLGYTVYGVEPSVWASRVARSVFKLPVKTGRIEKAGYKKDFFDIVTLLDVIEHLEDPKRSLLRLASYIKKGGIICIVTPNIESLASKLLGERWWHIRPSHFYYFSPATMKSLLQEAGFEVLLVRRYKWYLSADYILKRIFKLIHLPWYPTIKWMESVTIGLDLRDSMELYAKKR